MKILKIKALNINSLKGKTEIDFRTFLEDNALFAITGPTGAGKSTILDIITCALYARTPRLKNPDELMSRHTGECYCEVEFEIKEKVYRCSWTQKRARKKADGKFQSAKMELSDVQTAKVIKSTLRDVPKYVEELSGLDFERFKQSMVLAQGGFDAFLKADEKERSTLLEKMTGTDIYKKISLQIYDTHKTLNTAIEMDKKILNTTELLDNNAVDEKTKALESSKVEKESLDKKVLEFNNIKNWIETKDKLESEEKNYTELYENVVKEKEDKKEDFEKFALSNKALNVESLYSQYTTIETTLEKDAKNYANLVDEVGRLDALLKTQELDYNQSKKATLKAKEIFNSETKKIKEVRVLETQIDEKQKSLDILTQSIETTQQQSTKETTILNTLDKEYTKIQENATALNTYIETHSKDEKLLEILPLIKNKIEEYTTYNTTLKGLDNTIALSQEDIKTKKSIYNTIEKETQALKALYETKNQEYKEIEELSKKDTNTEELLNNAIKKQELVQKSYLGYMEYSKKQENEELVKSNLEKEYLQLQQRLETKKSLVKELKLHIETLREKKENELLLKKYEEDRKNLEEGNECYLCGSTTHPYINNAKNTNDTDTTIKLIEKETLLDKEEKELNSLDKSLTLVNAKINDTKEELKKIEECQKSHFEELQKESVEITDETQSDIENEIETLHTKFQSIKKRREEKEGVLKQRDQVHTNYNTQNIKCTEMEKELTKLTSDISHLQTEKEKSTQLLDRLRTELIKYYHQYNVEFEEKSYKENYEVLNTQKELFGQKLADKKELEKEQNKKELEKKEIETKLISLKDSLIAEEEKKKGYQLSIQEQKEKSTNILNVANISKYEEEVNKSYKSIEEIETKHSEELTKSKTKQEEQSKQEKSLKEEIKANKIIFEQLKEKLDVSIEVNGFENIEAFIKAILGKEQREELSILCKSIEEKYDKYKTLHIDTSKKLEEHKKIEIKIIPIDEVIDELKELHIKIEELQQNIGAISQTLQRNEKDRKKNENKIKELEKKQEVFKIWVKLNDMIGSADGNKFAKFAQGITLDQLISLANNHLIHLSSRYELQRGTDPKQLLEIEVCDSFQGDAVRSVSTLSGGESFIVSLSLALGLSELASQKISIDSLFLDEGFGTLDEDSLETALNALNLLQSSGKMVGVISHVEALKERIPLQIKVMPKGDGTSFVELG